jgi:hypothetical protein
MRDLTTIEIDRIKLLTENSIEFCLIEPTETGLGKAIMDATGFVRNYLKSRDIHDFEMQNQGQESKVQITSRFIEEDKVVNSLASLYRPNTKKGDPRIWFKGLGNYSKANDILAIIEFEGILYVINITQINFTALLNSALINPLKELVEEIKGINNLISDELLSKLRLIGNQGYIKSLVNSDTGIGRTLEKLLGIEMNSSKNPDYKRIELKSFRDSRGTRKGLFAKTPNWELSKFKSRVEILDNFGYWEAGVFRLYNTIRATGRNVQGLILKIQSENNWLVENSDKKEIGDFLVWELESLKKTLSEKHKETFWISTDSKKENGNEYFLYKSVEHTKNPLVNQFELLIDIGAITVDYNMKRLADGKVEDKGCNFKLKPSAMGLLFPPSQTYSLIINNLT